MSVQSALEFIKQARADEALREKVQALGRTAELESVLQVAREAGFAFTVEELRAAHRHDWTMRWVRYATGGAKTEPATT